MGASEIKIVRPLFFFLILGLFPAILAKKQGLQGEKLQGRQNDGEGEGVRATFSTLIQGAKINDSLGPPVGDILDTPLVRVIVFTSKERDMQQQHIKHISNIEFSMYRPTFYIYCNGDHGFY